MKLRRLALFVSLTVIGALGLTTASAATAAAPLWNLDLHHLETNFHPGETAEYWVDVNNVGDAGTSGPVTLTIKLAPGLGRQSVRESNDYVRNGEEVKWKCPGAVGSTTIVCT